MKGNALHVGSMGKEWTTSNGEYVNHNPMWIKIIHPTGEIKHVDWDSNYRKLRQAVSIEFPGKLVSAEVCRVYKDVSKQEWFQFSGYMIHESGIWSNVHKKWFFLPRRSSQASYDEVKDEFMGTNLLLMTDEYFNKITVSSIYVL